uniref:Putative polyprotein n=1 Tax=Albugo laibachii Nc14 TaxID=890382 RepID=F0WAF9_9STRA|nr:putative polyprotein [Albugo laibachii Nc14]|eukprot:CCA18130.1 putative polyprotein [Albugo laibachii Nc14]
MERCVNLMNLILLGSLSDDYDSIVKINENIQGIDLFRAKELLHREYEGLVRKEQSESALKSTRKTQQKTYGSQGKCFNCNQYGHKKIDCKKNRSVQNAEKAFTYSNGSHGGWILDNGASSHMCPFQEEFADIRSLEKPVLISVANGVQGEAKGIGTIRIILPNSRPIHIEDVLYVPQLYRRVMSITSLASKNLEILFGESSCKIEDEEELIVRAKMMGRSNEYCCLHHESLTMRRTSRQDPVSDMFGKRPTVKEMRVSDTPIWTKQDERSNIKRHFVFQKNPKTQHLDVNYNYDSDIRLRYVIQDDDQETFIMMQPVEHTLESMDVDAAGLNYPIMNETDADMLRVNQEQAIVPRGRYIEISWMSNIQISRARYPSSR